MNSKRSLRKVLNQQLKRLSASDVQQRGALLQQKVIEHDWFKQAKNISVYIHSLQKKEVPTSEIITNALNSAKKVYVPVVVNVNPPEMRLCLLQTPEDLEHVRQYYHIDDDYVHESIEGVTDYSEDEAPRVDLVIVPGLGFDSHCRRLGRGMGFYDRYLRIEKLKGEKEGAPVRTLAMAFSAQKVQEVPSTPEDEPVDEVVFESESS